MDRDTALRELTSGKPETQQRAVRVLGQWDDAEVLGALIGALQSPHRGIREAATDTLIEVGDGRAARLLLPLLRSSVPSVRNAARLLLQRLGKASPEILFDLAGDADVRMRIFAANILAETGDHDMAPPLMQLLADSDENVRDAAIVGLGRLGAPEAVQRIERLAVEGEPWSRFSAIDALGQIRTPSAARALIRLLSAAPEELQEPVVEALGRQAAPEAVPPLVGKLGQSPALRKAIVGVLAGPLAFEAVRLAGPDRDAVAGAVVDTLEENQLSPDDTAAAVGLLAQLGGRVGRSTLVRLLSSAQRVVQRAAVRAALKLGLEEAIPLLQRLQRDADPWFAAEIKAGLAGLGKESL